MLTPEQIAALPEEWRKLAKACVSKQAYRGANPDRMPSDLFVVSAVCGDALELGADALLEAARLRAKHERWKSEVVRAHGGEPLILLEKLDKVREENAKLLRFAGAVMRNMGRNRWIGADGDVVQEAALACGIAEEYTPTEACDEFECECADCGFHEGSRCNKLTPLGRAAVDAAKEVNA
jgi:hypothetical protein